MSADKYPCLFSRQMEAIVYLFLMGSRDGAVVRALASYQSGARFSKAPKSFRARKTIFRSSVSKNGEVYRPETSCTKGISLHL